MSAVTSSTASSSTRRRRSVGCVLKMRANAERCMFEVPWTMSTRDASHVAPASASAGIVSRSAASGPRSGNRRADSSPITRPSRRFASLRVLNDPA
jgi:hypothetical protein